MFSRRKETFPGAGWGEGEGMAARGCGGASEGGQPAALHPGHQTVRQLQAAQLRLPKEPSGRMTWGSIPAE